MSPTPVQRAILVDLLIFGDDKAANIASRTGFHRNTISSHMKTLADEGKISGKGGGVYRLRDDGREAAQGLVMGGYVPYQDENED